MELNAWHWISPILHSLQIPIPNLHIQCSTQNKGKGVSISHGRLNPHSNPINFSQFHSSTPLSISSSFIDDYWLMGFSLILIFILVSCIFFDLLSPTCKHHPLVICFIVTYICSNRFIRFFKNLFEIYVCFNEYSMQMDTIHWIPMATSPSNGISGSRMTEHRM